MNKLFKTLIVTFGLLALGSAVAAEKYKPFNLAYTANGAISAVVNEVKQKLTSNGFEIVGSYSPYDSATVIGVTNDQLKSTAAKTEFGGYGAVQRVAVTKVDGEIQVTYTNPTYMAHAYRMEGDLASVTQQMEKALGKKAEYGVEKGMSARKLRRYHYLFGMEYFDDVSMHHIATHKSYQDAVKTVEKNLAAGEEGVTKVYRVDIPGKDQTLFGVAMNSEDRKYQDDKYIMSEIDFKDIRSTAHLPYEILVSGNKAYSLYARFRIAINFPDLSMMGENSFMRIMETPEAVKRAHTLVSGGEWKEEYWQ